MQKSYMYFSLATYGILYIPYYFTFLLSFYFYIIKKIELLKNKNIRNITNKNRVRDMLLLGSTMVGAILNLLFLFLEL